MDRAIKECNNLVELIKKNQIGLIYKNEVARRLYICDERKYLKTYRINDTKTKMQERKN